MLCLIGDQDHSSNRRPPSVLGILIEPGDFKKFGCMTRTRKKKFFHSQFLCPRSKSHHNLATMVRFTPLLLPSRKGNLGIFELNNPRPLHALSLDMIHCMNDVWKEWGDMKAIIVKSSPNTKIPVFCAGGDVKAAWKAGMVGDGHGFGTPGLETADFFRHEYNLNYQMATSKIPQVSLWNGIVMGGGAGISVHGKYRVSTEHTTFAMPETAIGLFCDVGSMWWMPRLLTGGMANYVALTGARLQPQDLLYTGLATHYVNSERLDDLEIALVQASDVLNETATTADALAPVLTSFHQTPPVDPQDSFLAKHRSLIDESFQEKSVEAIVTNLKTMNNEFSQNTLQTLSKLSPTSLKITLEGLQRGADCADIGQVLQMEYRMSQACMRPGSDFYEGIRAVLVDKDHNPKWSPAILEEVTEEMVESYFAPLGGGGGGEHEWEVPSIDNSSKL